MSAFMAGFWSSVKLSIWFIVAWVGASLPTPFKVPAMSLYQHPAFTPSVNRWAPLATMVANEYGLDPNLVLSVIQVESCGDPAAISPAGAQGLMQVMPFHFEKGEESLDPLTNVRRGAQVLREGLRTARGDTALALAAYNGGPRLVGRAFRDWPSETRRYVSHAAAIYNHGDPSAPAVEGWLSSGGEALCQQAAATLARNSCAALPSWPVDAAATPTPPYSYYKITQGLHDCAIGVPAVDLISLTDGRILSPITGRVTRNDKDRLGNTVLEITNDRYRVRLLHGLYEVQSGARVSRGQVIGRESNQGNTYSLWGGDGAHTHISIYDLASRGWIDPAHFIP